MINYDQFAAVELRVALVKSAERVTGSDKLLKLLVDVGDDPPADRQIIAGIGKAYEPESLIGKKIVVVTNLEPRMLMGLESQGMVLAADGPVLLVPDKDVPPGSKIK